VRLVEHIIKFGKIDYFMNKSLDFRLSKDCDPSNNGEITARSNGPGSRK